MKRLNIVIVPCTAGHEYGYVGRMGKYSFWGRTRADVISQNLFRFWVAN